ncbi:UPF0746 protein DDB_G0281095, partial [Drosophila innubila]|uniref:UPF0746 protein DDB_G0281095 n=1 Tax=Drosophila innubila TaxID=198719 RepID=UPI00148CD89C
MLSIQSQLLLVLAMAGGLSLVSAAGRDELRPTVAPLVSSTMKPTSAPKLEAKPSKPLMIINAPPMKQKHLLKSTVQVKDAKPLQVTGFITKSGNIYEIEDKRGIGHIESRQADQPEDQQIVCNYGSVVIYSDVPCDQVTNVQVGEVQALKDEQPSSEQPPTEAQQSNGAEDNNTEAGNTPRQQSVPQRRRRRRRPVAAGQQQQRQQQRRRIRVNANGNRNGRAGQRRPANRQQQQQQQQQRRRRQQQRRRRQQQQQR